MTTLDQIRLLETKVEGAVEKIQQLHAENDALRSKCAELTNALNSKTEQLLAFTTSKEEIEEGIRNALDRLNFIESSVLTETPSNDQASTLTTGAVTENNEEADSFTSIDDSMESNNTQINEEAAKDENSSTPSDNNFHEESENEQPVDDEVIPAVNAEDYDNVSGPNFSSMDSVKQQSDGVSSETSVPENNSDGDMKDDDDGESFEYDIF